MNLLYLAPDIQEEILFLPQTEYGRDPVIEQDLGPLCAAPSWEAQRKVWRKLLEYEIKS